MFLQVHQLSEIDTWVPIQYDNHIYIQRATAFYTYSCCKVMQSLDYITTSKAGGFLSQTKVGIIKRKVSLWQRSLPLTEFSAFVPNRVEASFRQGFFLCFVSFLAAKKK